MMKKTVKGFLSLLLIAVLLSGMLTAAAADADTPADPVDPPEMSDPVTTDPAEPDPSNESDDAQPSENPDNPDPAEDPNPAEDPGEPGPSESPEIPADVTVTFCDTDGKTVIKTLVLKAGDVLNAAEIPVVTGDGLLLKQGSGTLTLSVVGRWRLIPCVALCACRKLKEFSRHTLRNDASKMPTTVKAVNCSLRM